MDGWVDGGGLRLAEGEFLVGTHTSSNMLPRQLIKSGTPLLIRASNSPFRRQEEHIFFDDVFTLLMQTREKRESE